MKKVFVLLIVAATAVMGANACTNFIVGKKASMDGSVFCTYNADDYGMFQSLEIYPAATHSEGEMRQIVDWDTWEYHGEIPEAAETYSVIGNINEYQVTIGETTYGGRHEMVDTTGTIDYGSLIYLALQRSRTAREAIKVMTTLAETYGYCSEGETFSVCDPNEAWIMEMQGAGPGSGTVVWVALRIPDEAICAHANQSRISTFDMNDKENVMHSANVIAFARANGWYDGSDEEFSWKDTYAKPDFDGRRYCDARVWSFFRHFADDFDRYLPWALGVDPDAEDMPLWIVPNRKVSLQDVQACMRDHYEGTALAIDTTDIGGGIWQMPYRPTPLAYEVDGVRCFNERPVSTQQTAFTFVAQMRSWLPREIGGILWYGNDDPNMVAYTPLYCSSIVAPQCYYTPDADGVTFSLDNAFWVCNWVSNMVYPRYSLMFGSLQKVRDELEAGYIANQEAIETQALALYADDKAAAVDYLNQYGIDMAQQMLETWKQLATYLIVKYNDMVIKPEEDGKFKLSPTGLPARPHRPGYPAPYARKLLQQSGGKYVYPEQ